MTDYFGYDEWVEDIRVVRDDDLYGAEYILYDADASDEEIDSVTEENRYLYREEFFRYIEDFYG